MPQDQSALLHRRGCLKITLALLFIWFSISFGTSILFREWMDAHLPAVGHAPFGFWMAQQGSIIGFVGILLAYAVLMNRMDRKYGYRAD